MQKFLLDTCTFLWIILDAPELSKRAKGLFEDPAHQVFLSAVSNWEISLKYKLGRLPLPESPDRFIPTTREKYGIDFLPLDEASSLSIHRLPDFHNDPFDRMLISQCITHGLTLLTPDPQIHRYPLLVAW